MKNKRDSNGKRRNASAGPARKLALRRLTLRKLTADELQHAAGGGSNRLTCLPCKIVLPY
ncbi:MAG TPA: hypothetical protein VKB80_24320 [Kofleriaceae bacterium]|nr:hypothetical protein [Kofleriaceae bacterium]